MSKPLQHGDHFRGVGDEIVSAMSALNMPPQALPTNELSEYALETGYLSLNDKWAKHAMEHLNAAMDEGRKAVDEMRHTYSVLRKAIEHSTEATLQGVLDAVHSTLDEMEPFDSLIRDGLLELMMVLSNRIAKEAKR